MLLAPLEAQSPQSSISSGPSIQRKSSLCDVPTVAKCHSHLKVVFLEVKGIILFPLFGSTDLVFFYFKTIS